MQALRRVEGQIDQVLVAAGVGVVVGPEIGLEAARVAADELNVDLVVPAVAAVVIRSGEGEE